MLAFALALPAYAGDLPAGFVRLAEIDPTIRQDMRYAGSLNFLGRPAKGYDAPVCILTEPAARALAEVQKQAASEGLTLVVFDCYRPAQAVDDFVSWTRQGGPPDPRWYPKVKRGDLIAEGYIGERSSHSRGSTVDLALGYADANAATAARSRLRRAKIRNAGIRHRFRLLRSAQLHGAFAAAGRRRPKSQRLVAAMQASRLPQLFA